MVMLPLALGWMPAPQRAQVRRWDGALVPEIALRLSLKKHHEAPRAAG